MAQELHLLLHLLLFLSLFRFSNQQDLNFHYNNFNQNQSDLHLDGSTRILSPNGLLQLTNDTSQQKGHAFFNQPFNFGSISSQSITFSTQFIFALVPKPGFEGGHGISFVLSSSIDLTEADPTQYLGLLNMSSNGSPDSHLLAIEFDTVLSAEFDDIDKNHVAINQNNMTSIESATASYFSDKESKNITLNLLNGGPIHVWIDYKSFLLTVTIAPLKIQKPSKPLLSRTVNLTAIFPDGKAFIGFSAATGTLVSFQNILGWSFSTRKELLKSFDISKLPRVPRLTKPKKIPPLLVALLILLALIGITALGGVYLYRRRRFAEVREPWEQDYGPLRYSYESLYKATRGFSRDYCLGKGGFGEVFKGNLPVIGDIAVKRLSHNAEQGLRQFIAEVVTMGSLQHRNLVPLLGYCRRKGELLLVSKYMEGGSVDQHLFQDDKPVLSWSQRLVILRDISSALCYLHTGANQVVLHRDIKAANVMLNKELNEAKLGDFGMAKIDDPKGSLSATAAVGTIGYMAPELITMGHSVKTDVYAYGAFLLEVTCGRHPVEPGLGIEKQNLVKWVCECWRKGSLLDSVDARLRGKFLVKEVEMVLKLGLACTSIAPDFRPDMERVVQYINGNLPLPDFSPDTPGIGGSSCHVLMAASSLAMPSTSMASSNSSPAANNSMFISHTILFGDGR